MLQLEQALGCGEVTLTRQGWMINPQMLHISYLSYMESDKNTTKIESSHAAISEYIHLSICIAGVFERAVENKAVKSF